MARDCPVREFDEELAEVPREVSPQKASTHSAVCVLHPHGPPTKYVDPNKSGISSEMAIWLSKGFGSRAENVAGVWP